MSTLTVAQFFQGRPEARRLFTALRRQAETLGAVGVKVSQSQVALVRGKKTFARVWLPRQYLGRGAPLVLTLGFRQRDPSPRWKQVVEPAPGRFTHHLEIQAAADIDAQVRAWLRQAWDESA
jgi:hypothetical protein